jgi:hypothetical protein
MIFDRLFFRPDKVADNYLNVNHLETHANNGRLKTSTVLVNGKMMEKLPKHSV